MLKKLNSQTQSEVRQVRAYTSCYNACKSRCGFGVTFAVGNSYTQAD